MKVGAEARLLRGRRGRGDSVSTDSVEKMRREESRPGRLLPRWLIGRPDGDDVADATSS